jgi:hypothetical protein
VAAQWTDAEHATIARLYPAARRNAVLRELPGRSWTAICLRASELGIGRRRHGPWTPEEDEALRRMYAEYSREGLLRALPGRTWAAINLRVSHLGLAGQRWRGYVAVYKAAKIAGYAPAAFLRILRAYQQWWAEHGDHERGVNPVLILKGGSTRGRLRVQRILDAQAAIDAAEWWLSR